MLIKEGKGHSPKKLIKIHIYKLVDRCGTKHLVKKLSFCMIWIVTSTVTRNNSPVMS